MPVKVREFCRILERQVERSYHLELSDRELVERYGKYRDESAFATLVERHGPMILGTCRRILRDSHAVDDAFQATFLVLARKASSHGWHDSIGGWLYKVAGNVCRKLLRKRKTRFVPLAVEPVCRGEHRGIASDFSDALDEELQALPSKYQQAILLCHLQSLTVDDAASQLGCTVGQLRGWLYRGREKLRQGLGKRGIAFSATAFTLALGQASAHPVPAALAQTLAAGGSPVATSLATEIIVMLFKIQMVRLAAASFAIAAFAGLGMTGRETLAEQRGSTRSPVAQNGALPLPANVPVTAKLDDEKDDKKIDIRKGIIVAVDAASNRLTVQTEEDGFKLEVELASTTTLEVAKRAVKLAELRNGMECKVQFQGDAKVPFKIVASWPTAEAVLKSLDVAKRTATISFDSEKGIDVEVQLPLYPDAEVTFDGIRAGLEDVPTGRKIKLELGADKKTIAGIHVMAEDGDVPAHLVSVEAGAKGIVVSLNVSNEKAERKVTLGFAMADSVKIRILGKDASAGDLKPNMPVVIRLNADRRTVTHILAGSPEERKDDDDDK